MAFSPSKPKAKRKKPRSKRRHLPPAICNLIIDFFNGELMDLKANYSKENK